MPSLIAEVVQILRHHAHDIRFAPIIAIALELLHSAKSEPDAETAMHGQSSRDVAELHAFRRRAGHYKEGKIAGLDETITALAENDIPVRGGVVETDRGYVATWRDERDSLVGVIIFMRAEVSHFSGQRP